MNDALKNLFTRRSVRKYSPRQIDDAELLTVLDAGTYAPTAMGRQSPIMLAVQDPADIAELERINDEIRGTPGARSFYGARRSSSSSTRRQAQRSPGRLARPRNLMNAAHALGLGSCWINRIRETFERPDGQALLKKWGVEGEWTGVGSCILGYPEGPEPSPAERKPGYYRHYKMTKNGQKAPARKGRRFCAFIGLPRPLSRSRCSGRCASPGWSA